MRLLTEWTTGKTDPASHLHLYDCQQVDYHNEVKGSASVREIALEHQVNQLAGRSTSLSCLFSFVIESIITTAIASSLSESIVNSQSYAMFLVPYGELGSSTIGLICSNRLIDPIKWQTDNNLKHIFLFLARRSTDLQNTGANFNFVNKTPTQRLPKLECIIFRLNWLFYFLANLCNRLWANAAIGRVRVGHGSKFFDPTRPDPQCKWPNPSKNCIHRPDPTQPILAQIRN